MKENSFTVSSYVTTWAYPHALSLTINDKAARLTHGVYLKVQHSLRWTISSS